MDSGREKQPPQLEFKRLGQRRTNSKSVFAWSANSILLKRARPMIDRERDSLDNNRRT